MQRLPIGRQTFSRLREDNCLYVDKTEAVHYVMDKGGCFFLARPRRFGKSLFLSTLEELAQSNRPLFHDTWINGKWDWMRKYPVIHLEFAVLSYKELGLEEALKLQILEYYKKYNVEKKTSNLKTLFYDLLVHLHENHGKVVLLIDEYDKPLLEYVENAYNDDALVTQATMKSFYSVLKGNEKLLHLTFITGITKFTKVSIFSDLNHLEDLTFHPRFVAAYGYTQAEILVNFEEYIQAFLQKYPDYTKESFLLKLKTYYNGYSWDGNVSIYNPFGLLNFFNNFRFSSDWFESGTPTFLVKKLLNEQAFYMEEMEMNLSDLNFRTLQQIENVPLMFQAGYLTIKSLDDDSNCVLDYPNDEVRENFYRFLLRGLGEKTLKTIPPIVKLAQAFETYDIERAQEVVQHVFANLPYDVYNNKTPRQVEGFYHGIIHILFHYIGMKIESEVHTTRGRADAILTTENYVYIFEFKIDKSSNEAMQQILTKNYAAKYQNTGKKIILIGANFSTETREMDDWEIQII